MAKRKKIIVHSFEEAVQALDGKHYVLDGVSGVIRVSRHKVKYPYPHEVESITHYPDKKGRKTAAYMETRRKLGDDWSTDLQHSEELGDIMGELGIELVQGGRYENR